MNLNTFLNSIPDGLKKPLIAEYNSIIQHYMEQRWTGSELSGGKFCEIVYTILDGHAKGLFALTPTKPANFVDACKRLENNPHVPRSFQILIPRMLSPLYEIRNNRNVGHVGGDVDPNSMDAQAVVAMCSWIFGELIRVFHNSTVKEAQKMVDFITNRKIPLVWEVGKMKRILKPSISLKDQVLLLISSSSGQTKTDELFEWIEYENKGYFLKLLRQLHIGRFVELSVTETEIEILPPGTTYVEQVIAKLK
ncbi:MAG: hypothetical protein H0W62_09520 [Chitinophagales bacterium]|nr:hypothetical protein [Chitinophagales bacterium]